MSSRAGSPARSVRGGCPHRRSIDAGELPHPAWDAVEPSAQPPLDQAPVLPPELDREANARLASGYTALAPRISPAPPSVRTRRMDLRHPVAHPVSMQALKMHGMVDDTVVRALTALSPLRGHQRVELIALGEAQPSAPVAPVAGGLRGRIQLKDDFDAPLPDGRGDA